MLCVGASGLLSARPTSHPVSVGPTSHPVSCLEPASGLAGQTHQLASFTPQEVASVEKIKQHTRSFRPSEQITGVQSPKIDLSLLSRQASGASGKCFA